MQIQISEALGSRLEKAAASVGKSPEEYAADALQQSLEDREDLEEVIEISRRIASGEEKTYTLEEVERRLGLDD